MPSGPAQRATGGLFRYIFQTLLRGKWWLIGTFVLVVGLIVVGLKLSKPLYEASSTLVVESQEEMGGGSLGVFGLGTNRDVLVEVEILQSLDIARRVAQRLLVVREAYPDFTIFNTEGDEVLGAVDVARRLQEDYVSVEQPRREVNVVRVTVQSNVPQEAKMIANLYAEEYTARNLQVSREEAAGLRRFLEAQLRSREDSLRATEQALQAYQERENAVDLSTETEQLAQQMALLQTQRDQAQVELEMVQARLASLRDQIRAIEPRLTERVASTGLEQHLADLTEQITDLEVKIALKYAQNPSLRQNPNRDRDLPNWQQQLQVLRQQRETLTQQYVDEVLSTGGIDVSTRAGDGASGVSSSLAYISRLQRELAEQNIQAGALRARLGVIDARLRQYNREFQQIPAQARQLAGLQRQRQTLEETYNWFQEQLEEARVAEESQFGYVRVLDLAELPDVPVAPRTLYNLILGGLLGGILGLLIVFGREMMDNRIRRPDDIKQLGLPLLGVTPRLRRALRKAPDPETSYAPELVMYHYPMSPAAESFQRVLSALELAMADEYLQVVLVTSPKNEEGKTLAAANLAIGMAKMGQRTLLLDANLWQPNAHTMFGESMAPGLTNVLTHQAHMRDALRPTAVDNLYFLPLGDAETLDAAFVASRDVAALLVYLRRSFERIVIDAGALLSAGGALALTALSDAVVMVVRAAETSASDVQETQDALRQVNAPYTGVILNDFDAQQAFGYYNNQGYYGRYGNGRELRSLAKGVERQALPAGRSWRQLRPGDTPVPEPAPQAAPPFAPQLPPGTGPIPDADYETMDPARSSEMIPGRTYGQPTMPTRQLPTWAPNAQPPSPPTGPIYGDGATPPMASLNPPPPPFAPPQPPGASPPQTPLPEWAPNRGKEPGN